MYIIIKDGSAIHIDADKVSDISKKERALTVKDFRNVLLPVSIMNNSILLSELKDRKDKEGIPFDWQQQDLADGAGNYRYWFIIPEEKAYFLATVTDELVVYSSSADIYLWGALCNENSDLNTPTSIKILAENGDL